MPTPVHGLSTGQYTMLKARISGPKLFHWVVHGLKPWLRSLALRLAYQRRAGRRARGQENQKSEVWSRWLQLEWVTMDVLTLQTLSRSPSEVIKCLQNWFHSCMMPWYLGSVHMRLLRVIWAVYTSVSRQVVFFRCLREFTNKHV